MRLKCCTADLFAGVPGSSGTVLCSTDQSRLCQECARVGKTCCQGHDIYVTRGDCLRIFNCLQDRTFYEYRSCCDPAYAEQSEDPLWEKYVFRSDGRRRVLKHKDNGDCMLLTSTGCLLPIDARPLVCRLFPHLYSAGGITDQWDGACPAAATTAAIVMENGIAGIAQCDAAKWHQLLYYEVLWEKIGDEDWINL